MKNHITTFIFDCFGVVISPVIGAWYKENRLNKGFVDENLKSVLRQFDLGNLSEDDLIEYFLKYEGLDTTKEKLREDIDGYLSFNSGLIEIIEKIKQKGFKVILLSNAHHQFFERKIYTTYPKFKELFDEIIISSNIGMVKPDKDIYLHTLEKINTNANESLFIDDSKSNVDTAIKLGMHGFVYTDNLSFIDFIAKLGINLDI